MIALLSVILLLALFITSILYYLGFIPRTILYAKRIYDLNKVSEIFKKFPNADSGEVCKMIKDYEPSREKYKDDDIKYFSFGGSKTVSDIIGAEKYAKYINMVSLCNNIDSGILVTKKEFIDKLDFVGVSDDISVSECENLKYFIFDTKQTVIDDGKFRAPMDIISELYPNFEYNFEVTCSN
jgi:hypothetical protein